MVLRRLMIVAALSSVLGLVASWLAAAYVSRRLAALPKVSFSATSAPRAGDVAAWHTEVVATETRLDPTSAAQRRGRAPKARAGKSLTDDLKRGIRKLGERRYEIGRSAIDLARRNAHLLSRWIRVAPELRDGTSAGFRLVFVSADGPFGKLGLRTGDVLVSVNGLDIRTPDRALDAYAKLQSASRFTLGIVRDGREISYEYSVR